MDQEPTPLRVTASLSLLVMVEQESWRISPSHLVGLVEKTHISRNKSLSPSMRCTRLLHTSTRFNLKSSLESSSCHVPRTSAERDGTGRRDIANPRRTREPNRNQARFPGLFSSVYGKASEHAVISGFPVSAVGGTSEPAGVSSFSAEVTAPLPVSSEM